MQACARNFLPVVQTGVRKAWYLEHDFAEGSRGGQGRAHLGDLALKNSLEYEFAGDSLEDHRRGQGKDSHAQLTREGAWGVPIPWAGKRTMRSMQRCDLKINVMESTMAATMGKRVRKPR